MVRAIKKIEEDLKEITEAIAEIAQEIYGTYQGYLKALGQGMRQQLIFASYHICTQAYPEAFLNLSFSQRQKMQEELQEIANSAVQELQELLQQNPEAQEKLEVTSQKESMLTVLDEKNQEKPELTSKLNQHKKRIKFDSSVLSTIQISSEINDNGKQKVSSQIEDSLNRAEAENVENAQDKVINKLENIDAIISWQENLEKQIPENLKKYSHRANCILQKAKILPQKIPEKVLEAGTKIESGDTPVGGLPNLLNLLIEAENPAAEKDSQDTRIIAVNMRLSEIEFTDVNVTAWRNKIRSLLGKLSQLQREFRKKQYERAVLEAESAWRSSWYER